MRCVNTCASTDGARRAQNCALYTSVCFVVSVPLFAMCSRLFMLCVKMYAVCRSQMFVNMRCKIHSLYSNLVFLFELVHVFGKVPCLASGASLLSFSLFVGPVLKFHSVGTSLMMMFDLYFSKRWSFLFPDTCLTWRRLRESYSSNWSQDSLHRVSPGLFAS